MGWVSVLEDLTERLADAQHDLEANFSTAPPVVANRVAVLTQLATSLVTEARELLDLATNPELHLAGEVRSLRQECALLASRVAAFELAAEPLDVLKKKITQLTARNGKLFAELEEERKNCARLKKEQVRLQRALGRR